jgi:ankyrin repeat protein
VRPGYSLEQRLIDAVFLDDTEDVQALLAAGAGTEGHDEDGRTPLMAATMSGHAGIVRLLLDAGADPNASDGDGWTALHVAAHRQNLDLVWTLLRAGADPNAQDQDGNSVLWRATLTSLGRAGVIDLLRRAGARDDLSNRAGLSPNAIARRLRVAFAAAPRVRPS